MARKMPDEDRQLIAKLYKQGVSIDAIAARTGWARDTVRKLGPAFTVAKGSKKPWNEDEEEFLVSSLRDDRSWQYIADHLSRSRNACQVHYNEMLQGIVRKEEQEKILVNTKFGKERTAKAVKELKLPLESARKFIPEDDIYGLWCRAMDIVRNREECVR